MSSRLLAGAAPTRRGRTVLQCRLGAEWQLVCMRDPAKLEHWPACCAECRPDAPGRARASAPSAPLGPAA